MTGSSQTAGFGWDVQLLDSNGGRIAFGWFVDLDTLHGFIPGNWGYSIETAKNFYWNVGFAYQVIPSQAWVIRVPYWSLILASALLPFLWWFVGQRKRRRGAIGTCKVCGYDLRATLP